MRDVSLKSLCLWKHFMAILACQTSSLPPVPPSPTEGPVAVDIFQ